MLDVRRLHVLREVVSHGSFSAAASALGYTQSAVSQHIAALERQIGAKLLERGPRGVTPTDAGRLLVGHAAVVLARLEEAEADLRALLGAGGPPIRVAAFPSAAATLVPGAVAAVQALRPEAELDVVVADPDDAVALMRAGRVDLAVLLEVPGDELPEYPGLRSVPILDDRMHALLPPRHRLAAQPTVRMAELAEDRWVLGSPTGTCPDARILRHACRAAGFRPRVAFRSLDYPAIQGLVAEGIGVSLIPELALAGIRDDVVVRPVDPAPPLRRVVAATLDGPPTDAAQTVLDALRRAGERRRAELAEPSRVAPAG